MRIRFKPTPEQRSALRAQLTRVQQPATALRILRPTLPAEFTPARAVCTVQSVHSDRFVVRVELCSNAGEERAYALKAYSDDFGEKVWAHARALAEHYPPNHNGLCLPNHYVPRERLMVFPWVDGVFLSEIVDERKLELVREAAGVAARLHRLGIVPDNLTTAQMFVDEARAWCDRLRYRWPETGPTVERLLILSPRRCPPWIPPTRRRSTATWRRGSSCGPGTVWCFLIWTCSDTPTPPMTPATFWPNWSGAAFGTETCRRTPAGGRLASVTPISPRCRECPRATCPSTAGSR